MIGTIPVAGMILPVTFPDIPSVGVDGHDLHVGAAFLTASGIARLGPATVMTTLDPSF